MRSGIILLSHAHDNSETEELNRDAALFILGSYHIIPGGRNVSLLGGGEEEKVTFLPLK